MKTEYTIFLSEEENKIFTMLNSSVFKKETNSTIVGMAITILAQTCINPEILAKDLLEKFWFRRLQ